MIIVSKNPPLGRRGGHSDGVSIQMENVPAISSCSDPSRVSIQMGVAIQMGVSIQTGGRFTLMPLRKSLRICMSP